MDKNIPTNFFLKHFTWAGICNTNGGSPSRCDIGPAVIINILLPNLIIFAGVIFFILIIYYGWRLVQVSGSEIGPQQLHKAQEAVSYSVVGFLLVVTAFFVLQIVGTITGINFTNPPPF